MIQVFLSVRDDLFLPNLSRQWWLEPLKATLKMTWSQNDFKAFFFRLRLFKDTAILLFAHYNHNEKSVMSMFYACINQAIMPLFYIMTISLKLTPSWKRKKKRSSSTTTDTKTLTLFIPSFSHEMLEGERKMSDLGTQDTSGLSLTIMLMVTFTARTIIWLSCVWVPALNASFVFSLWKLR